MENELSELYTVLARHISSMIPVAWEKVYYLGEVGKQRESWSSVFYFKDLQIKETIKSHTIPEQYNVSQEIYNELQNELYKILLDMYSCFERHSQPLWEQVGFSFNSEGQFNIDYYYDVMSEEDGGQVGREIVWAYRTFGYKPKEGSFTRKLLESYLKKDS